MAKYIRFKQPWTQKGVSFAMDDGTPLTRYLMRTYTESHVFACVRPNERYIGSCVSLPNTLRGTVFEIFNEE